MDVGLAYNEQYRMFGKHCYGCNETLRLDEIYLDGEEYKDRIAKENHGDFYYEVEPNTGLMTRTRMDTTMVFTFYCYRED